MKSPPIADYVALALIRNGAPEDAFFALEKDFSGSTEELHKHAEALCGFPITDRVMMDAIRSLADCGLVRITDDPYSGTYVKVKTSEFQEFVKKADAEYKRAIDDEDEIGVLNNPSDYSSASALEKHPLFEDYRELGSDWLSRALNGLRTQIESDGEFIGGGQAGDAIIAPASDRLVSIDHNSREYEQVVSVTEAADEAVRASNSINDESRSWIRAHIKAGLELIKNHKILASAAAALLLQPLLNAYYAVTEEPAKQAIMAAIDAVRTFFGL